MPREEKRRMMLEMMPKGGVCAEIGVWDGGFSEVILEITQPRKLHLIDPWVFQPDFSNSAFGRKANVDAMERRYEGVRRKFLNDARVVIHREMSHEALSAMEDGSLDWVYIDGNHNYEVVSGDLELCLRKVRPDGVIAGDDFLWTSAEDRPVRRAVRKVVADLGKQVDFHRLGQQYVLNLARPN